MVGGIAVLGGRPGGRAGPGPPWVEGTVVFWSLMAVAPMAMSVAMKLRILWVGFSLIFFFNYNRSAATCFYSTPLALVS